MNRSAGVNCSARGQQGQALVLGLVLTGVVVIVFVRYFGVGQVVAAKARQLHSLDAAAYSGALIQARALNMLAYLNRSQIGHQVAMAHLVTLGSWAAFGANQARQASVGNPPAYLIAMLFGADQGTAYAAARAAAGLDALAQADGPLAHAYAGHDSVVRDLFTTVQDSIVASLPDARWAAMQAVLEQNYSASESGADFDLAVSHDNWSGYVQRYSSQHQLRPFIQSVAQLYDFLSPRNHTASNPWAVEARCPHLRHQLRRRGSTTLDPDGRWQSADTESFHALRSNRWIGCHYREYPMGWGWIPSAPGQDIGSGHVSDPPKDFAAQDFWRWVKQATDWDIVTGDANPLANSRAVAGRQRWRGGALPDYFDVGADAAGKALRFTVELKHAGPEGLTITTRSAAETFFQRPEPRTDRRLESSNLFHSYWQARLASPNDLADGSMTDAKGFP